jgi:hypothetical protein
MLKEARALLHPQRFLAVQHLETLDQIIQFLWLPPIHTSILVCSFSLLVDFILFWIQK